MIDTQKLGEVVASNIERLCRHFFPNGRKENGEWKIADTSGERGSSLGICLSGDKAALFNDRANDGGGNFVQLLEQSRGLLFLEAVDEIGRFLGVDLEDHQEEWANCNRLSPDQEKRLAAWRGYSPELVHWLSEHDLIRAYGANGNARWVFPIHLGGKVAGTHSRLVEWTGPGRCKWLMLPKKENGGPGAQPFVIGNLKDANAVHLSESTWDILTLCDRLNLHETDGFAALCTRGASNDKLVSELPDSIKEIYLWPQNDQGGRDWLKRVLPRLPKSAVAKIVLTPPEHKDLNDWVKSGASTDDLLRAIRLAEPWQSDGGKNGDALEPTHKEPPKLASELHRDFWDESSPVAEKPLRSMLSWIAYGNREVDRSQYHVGEGFLEIGGYVMLIGQSYVGKSTFIAQLSICLAIARTWLFFKLERALRVMVVQAEDPENKLVKMGHMFKRMGLTDEELRLADQNTVVLTIRDLQDGSAIAEIDRHALVFKPDVIVINPMTSYLGSSVYKDEAINAFLRVSLTPLLDRLKASAIVVHHPPKPITSDREPKDLTAFELQYGSAGMAALTNAPRGNMFLTHVDGDVFKLQVGKGFEDLGTGETIAYLRRSKDDNGVMLWERCESEKAEEANEKEAKRKSKKRSDQFVPYDRVLKCFNPAAKYPRTKIIELSKKELGKGRDWTDDAMKQLVFEKKLAKSEEPNPRGQPFVFYHLPTVLEPTEPDPTQ
jgi:hypothetical protein